MNRNTLPAEKKVLRMVIGISIIMTIANAGLFFDGLLHKPKGMVYLAVVHWFEDYFFYVSHFTQGAHGAWLVANRYTSELTPSSFVYWTNLMMGKIGGLLGLSPIWSYNLWLMGMVCLTLITSYFVIRLFLPKRPVAQLTAFIFSLFATSPMPIVNGHIVWNPIHEINSPHYATDRLGGVPTHSIQTFLLYFLTLLVFSKPRTKLQHLAFAVLDPLSMMLLTITNPFMGAMWITTVWIYTLTAACIKHMRLLKRFITPTIPWARLTILTISFVIAFAYMNTTIINTLPRLQGKLWDAAQSTHPAIGAYVLSGGPLFFLAIIGIIIFFFSPRPLLLFAVLMAAGTHLVYFSPLPALFGVANGRFVFPAIYPFLAILAVYGIQLATGRITSRIHGLRPHTIFLLIIALFLIYSTPTIVWEFDRRIIPRPTSNPFYYLNYLPTDAYDGMIFLSRQLPYDDVVLGSYLSRTDLLVPALTNHTSYSGHAIETINVAEKNRQNVAFFRFQLSSEIARQWMRENRIRYVILTSRDMNPQPFEAHYPFLTTIYHTKNITIYRME